MDSIEAAFYQRVRDYVVSALYMLSLGGLAYGLLARLMAPRSERAAASTRNSGVAPTLAPRQRLSAGPERSFSAVSSRAAASDSLPEQLM